MTNEKPASPTQGELAVKALEKAWSDFCDENPDDLTSPEDLPNHALMTCEQFVQYALATLDRTTLPPAEGWQPIETGPKDGHAVLLLVPSSDGFIWTVEGAYQNGQWNAVHRDNVQPTHWAKKLPSPAAPRGSLP